MILNSPQWDRSCAVCLKYVPKDDGTFTIDKRTSLPLLRGKAGDTTPCGKCPKVPDWLKRKAAGDFRVMRAGALEMTDANRAAYKFYLQCRAVNQFPDDPLVRWVAGIAREAHDEYERRPVQRLSEAMAALVAILPYLIRR